jgi:RES domain-containing protein
MKLFRLTKKKYATELSGIGAAKFGNRWNSKGTEMLYTAESRALAMAEVLVHLNFATLPSDFLMMEIQVAENITIEKVELKGLPTYWNEHPPNVVTQKIGDTFINANSNCILKVPSAVVQGDFNYLLNPHHTDFKKVKIVGVSAFPFDKRLLF